MALYRLRNIEGRIFIVNYDTKVSSRGSLHGKKNPDIQ